MLRSGVARTCSLQPILLRGGTTTTTTTATTSPYSTFPASPFSARSKLINNLPAATTSKPSSILILHASQQQKQQPASVAPRRHASSSSKVNDSSSSSSAHDQDAAAAARSAQRVVAAAGPGAPPLDWETFFQLRKSRRRWQVGFSVLLSLASGAGGALVLSTGAADPLTSQVPLDPIMTMGLITIGCVALGWLAGPSLGSAVFYLIRRKYKVPMTVKESQFFARIKKNRVDPSNSSTGNPVPDFYGEKISSVAGYRQWLKDQRAYNKKRTTFI